MSYRIVVKGMYSGSIEERIGEVRSRLENDPLVNSKATCGRRERLLEIVLTEEPIVQVPTEPFGVVTVCSLKQNGPVYVKFVSPRDRSCNELVLDREGRLTQAFGTLSADEPAVIAQHVEELFSVLEGSLH